MGKFRTWIVKRILKDYFSTSFRTNIPDTRDASSQQKESVFGIVKKLGLRFGDTTNSKDYEEPEFDLEAIRKGCDIDGYLRQGVDKYVDQIFKEGWTFYGKNENAVSYVKLRLEYMAEVTGVPLDIFLIEIAEDVVKYSNCVIAKSRSNDPNAFPQGVSVTGLNGSDPVAAYFLLNPTTMRVRRDKNGTIKGWQQETEDSDTTVKFKAEDIEHIYYKRERGNAFGTPFLLPVLNDVRSLRETEDTVLKMVYKNVYPFLHASVGDSESSGSPKEIEDAKSELDDMDPDGGVVTSSRVNITAVDTSKVINAEPYLRYMEERVFSGMGIPGILFGRGGTANRSTGDNMSNEMGGRSKAFQKVIAISFTFKIIKELLLEGGFDPILNPDDKVEFRFNDSDIDSQIKQETHIIYKYEHEAITEDEMRSLLGMDPVTDRAKMYINLVTLAKSNASNSNNSSSSSKEAGNKETNNKQKPTNQYGQNKSPKKTTNSTDSDFVKVIYDFKKDIKTRILGEEFSIIKNSIATYSLITQTLVDEVYHDYVKEEFLKLAMYLNDEFELEDGTNDSDSLVLISEILIDNLYDNLMTILSKEVR